MVNSWPIVRLEELCQVTSSKRIYAKELVPLGVPFLKSTEIIEKVNGQAHSSLLYISEERFQEILNQSGGLEAGDVLLTSRGTLGIPYVVRSVDRFHFADGNLTWFRNFRHLDSRYLAYFFLSPQGKAELKKCVIGSSQAAYTIAALKKIEIALPPLSVQRRIASILSAYDELIENIQRRIKIMESMARALYREWFVHFRFPGHESTPFVPSLLGDIPQGWEVTAIGELCTVVLGGTPSRSVNEYWVSGTIPWLKSGKLNEIRVIEGTELITRVGLEKSAAKLMPPKTVLIAITGAILISFLEIEACANQSVVGIYAPQKVCPEYLHLYLRENIAVFESKMSGSAQQHINKEIVQQTPILVPSVYICESFMNFVQPIYEEIKLALFKIENLRRTRDLLLPRLLSGQIEV